MRKLTLLLVLFVVSVPSVGGNAGAQTRALNVGDATINYDVTGKGPTVVFIHGWTHNISVWDDQVPAFKSRYQVVRYDSRGFGKSTGFADESAEPQDLLLLLEALHAKKAYIVGHSRGGSVALRFANAYPSHVAGLVLYGAFPTGFPAPAEFAQMFASLPAIAKQNGLDSVGKLMLTSPIAWVPAGRSDITERYRRLWASYNGKDLLEPHPESGRIPAVQMSQLDNIKVPTLVIYGDHEAPFIAAAGDSLAAHIPGAKKVVIPNAGHGAHFAQPASFNSALMDFFFDVERNKKK
jgi:pimeloyl-ACP methyl ester carboxylesterase